MCSHYESVDAEVLKNHFQASLIGVQPYRSDMWPDYKGVFVRGAGQQTAPEEAQHREAVVGSWGLIPYVAKEQNKKYSTFNAKAETADKLYSFRGAFRRGQRCIIPAQSIYEPDWRSGKSVATRFTRTDGEPMGIAGLWDRWISPEGEVIESYTMFTISAEDHPLFKLYHRPGKEKRQVVILPSETYGDWLACDPSETRDFLVPYSADLIHAAAAV